MKGPTTRMSAWKSCTGCECLLSKNLKSKRFPRRDRTVNHCKHPKILENSKGVTEINFICQGKVVKTPAWCGELA